MDQPLNTLVAIRLQELKPDKCPQWVKNLVVSAGSDSEPPVFYIKSTRHETLETRMQYRTLDGTQPLLQALKSTTFMEFPQIEVCTQDNFPDSIAAATTNTADVPAQKRQKVGGHETGTGLLLSLGGYGSDGERASNEGASSMQSHQTLLQSKPGDLLGGLNEYSDESSDSEYGGDRNA